MIAVDWGTSSFRAYRLDGMGRVLDLRAAPAGILTIAAGGFPAALETQLGDWLDDAPIVMSGMIGSRQGWREVPYVECPADVAAIARGLAPVEWGAGQRAWIVPGLSCRDVAGVPDVMRGEETQILGALEALPAGEAVICLPGTHSKWARVREGRILSFATAMTGEAFAVLRRHSILGRLMPEGSDGATDAGWFHAGLRRAGEPGGLLHHLFGVRSRGLFGEVPEAGLASYLSGMLIGREIADMAPPAGCPVHLIGAKDLVALYALALPESGREPIALDADCVARGLFRLAAHLSREAPHPTLSPQAGRGL
jgi:2-dehydro-3-deoxygalactonokinase